MEPLKAVTNFNDTLPLPAITAAPSRQLIPMPAIEELDLHKKFMRSALDMAETALHTDEVPVGCVFICDGEIIGRGMNDTNRSLCGTRHAEFIAIETILRTYPPSVFQKTDLYVTVEPCVMCASALRQLRIRRVFFGCLNDRFGGTGGVLRIHEDPGVDPSYPCYGGINHDEAIMLLRRFYIQENERAPQPLAKKSRTLKTDVLPFGEGFPRERDVKKKKSRKKAVATTPDGENKDNGGASNGASSGVSTELNTEITPLAEPNEDVTMT